MRINISLTKFIPYVLSVVILAVCYHKKVAKNLTFAQVAPYAITGITVVLLMNYINNINASILAENFKVPLINSINGESDTTTNSPFAPIFNIDNQCKQQAHNLGWKCHWRKNYNKTVPKLN